MSGKWSTSDRLRGKRDTQLRGGWHFMHLQGELITVCVNLGGEIVMAVDQRGVTWVFEDE